MARWENDEDRFEGLITSQPTNYILDCLKIVIPDAWTLTVTLNMILCLKIDGINQSRGQFYILNEIKYRSKTRRKWEIGTQ